MSTFRPDLLLKDELQFELLGRNVLTFDKSTRVEDLRKLIHLHKDVPFEIKNFNRKISLREELQLVEAKVFKPGTVK